MVSPTFRLGENLPGSGWIYLSKVDEADLEAELNMLSDELGELDTDTRYLDDALNAPGVPVGVPAKPSKVIY